MEAFLTSVFGLVLFLIVRLFLIKLGWLLFMVPVFHMADLTWLQAIGFSLLASAFKTTSFKKDQ